MFEVFQAKSGEQSARVYHSGISAPMAPKEGHQATHNAKRPEYRLLHSAIEPEIEFHYFPEQEIWGETLVLAGTGLGWHLNLSLPGWQNLLQVVLLDYHPEATEWTRKRIQKSYPFLPCFLLDATENCKTDEILRHLSCLLPGKVQWLEHQPSRDIQQTWYDQTEIRIGKALRTKIGKQEKVFLLSPGHFLHTELQNASSQLGLGFLQGSEPQRRDDFPGESRELLQKIWAQETPKLIISVNGEGWDLAVQKMAHRLGVTVALWFVDDPRPILGGKLKGNNLQELFSNCKAFCWDRCYLSWLKDQGFSHVEWLALGVDTTKEIRDLPQEHELVFPTVKSKSANHPAVLKEKEVVFVGSAMGNSFMARLKSRLVWKQEWDKTLEQAARKALKTNLQKSEFEVSADYFWTPPPQNPEYPPGFPQDARNRQWYQSLILHMATRYKRLYFLTALVKDLKQSGSDVFLRIVGDVNEWKELWQQVGEDPAQVLWQDPVRYGSDLFALYKEKPCQINITSVQMPGALTQRLFDGTIHGAVVFSDQQKDLKDIAWKIPTFQTPGELAHLVNRFYQQPDEQETQRIKQARILQDSHGYSHRLAKMIRVSALHR